VGFPGGRQLRHTGCNGDVQVVPCPEHSFDIALTFDISQTQIADSSSDNRPTGALAQGFV
jgi:hypothetical protein